MIKGIIFDLDGTLVNTLGDLTDAVNHTLNNNGYPLRTIQEVQSFIGNGIRNLIERSINKKISSDDLSKLESEFLAFYGIHYCEKSRLYQGIAELIDALKVKGMGVAIVTNKAQSMTDLIVKKLFDGEFKNVFGKSEAYPLKPNPSSTFKTLEILNVSANECLFVGDSAVDIKTAQNSGIKSVGVGWGYRSVEELRECGADYIIDIPSQLLSIIEEIK